MLGPAPAPAPKFFAASAPAPAPFNLDKAPKKPPIEQSFPSRYSEREKICTANFNAKFNRNELYYQF